jgi:hypothetical protein
MPYASDVIRVLMPGYLIKEGSFSRVQSAGTDGWVPQEFISCREQFQNNSEGITRILFAHRHKFGSKIAAFIDNFENRLGLEKKSVFGPTQRTDITWLNTTRWWTNSSIRRSLFTALLRAGQNYNPKKDNFESTLFANCYGRQNYYTRDTKRAILRFLDGYTNISKKAKKQSWQGWWDCFHNSDSFQYKQIHGFYCYELLVKKDPPK